MKLKEESILTIYGLNYKDNKLKALDLLERDGNPFEFSIYDFEGRLAIDLGVYGAPETFFIDKNGLIRERHVGVIDERVWEEKFSKYLNNQLDINKEYLFNDIYIWAENNLTDEGVEYIVSLMMEPYDNIVKPMINEIFDFEKSIVASSSRTV